MRFSRKIVGQFVIQAGRGMGHNGLNFALAVAAPKAPPDPVIPQVQGISAKAVNATAHPLPISGMQVVMPKARVIARLAGLLGCEISTLLCGDLEEGFLGVFFTGDHA